MCVLLVGGVRDAEEVLENGNSQWRRRKKSMVGEKRTGDMRKGKDEKSDMWM